MSDPVLTAWTRLRS